MEISIDFVKESEIINEGTTCYILKHKSGLIYKLYKGALSYISGSGDYRLEENETLERLEYLVSKKDDVHLTDLPEYFLKSNGKPVGVPLTYYENGMDLKKYLIENYSIENIEIFKKQMLDIVGELIENGIIPTDPHFENFLVCNIDGSLVLHMIDTDDQYVSVYPNNKKDVWYESNVMACYRVIDLSFKELEEIKSIE